MCHSEAVCGHVRDVTHHPHPLKVLYPLPGSLEMAVWWVHCLPPLGCCEDVPTLAGADLSGTSCVNHGTTSEKPPSPTRPREMGGAAPVIVLADLAHSHQCPEVLIGLVRVDVVEGAAVPWVTVGGCEVDGYLQGPGW